MATTAPSPSGPDRGANALPQENILPTLTGVGYGNYQVRPTNFLISFVLHTLAILGLLYSGLWVAEHKEQIKAQVINLVNSEEVSPYLANLPKSNTSVSGGGGGGDRDKLPAPKGGLPKASMEQFTPPMVVKRNENPKLPMDPTVVVPPNIPLPQSATLGDPFSKVSGILSNGTGSGGGIGSGSGGGVGSGRGPGVGPGSGGGIGGGVFHVGGGVLAPRVIYNPDPEYSEEARKARYQGTVVLLVIVDQNGRIINPRVQRSLGMGLDEKAIEAVRAWKFEPAKKDGQPVSVEVIVEVNFRLY